MSLASYHCSTPGSAHGFTVRALPDINHSIDFLHSISFRRRGCLRLAAAVAAEHPCRREFAKLVADHVLRHEQFRELAAVVNKKSVADKIGHHGAIARPGFERFAA